jgi:hypothetical protein
MKAVPVLSRLKLRSVARAICIAAALQISACATTLRVDPSLVARTEALPVKPGKGRLINAPISFGEYRTLKVREGSYDNWAIPIFGMALDQHRYSARLTDGLLEMQINCGWKHTALRGGVVTVKWGDDETLRCALLAGTGGPWTLRMYAGYTSFERAVLNRVSVFGTVEDAEGDTTLVLESVHHTVESRSTIPHIVGLQIRRDKVVLAAIQTLGRRRVWIAPELNADDRLLVAGLTVAMLLSDFTSYGY